MLLGRRNLERIFGLLSLSGVVSAGDRTLQLIAVRLVAWVGLMIGHRVRFHDSAAIQLRTRRPRNLFDPVLNTGCFASDQQISALPLLLMGVGLIGLACFTCRRLMGRVTL